MATTLNFSAATIDELLAYVQNLGQEGYLFQGVATTTSTPVEAPSMAIYIADKAGTYTNYGNIVVNAGEVALLKLTDSTWTKEVLSLTSKEYAISLFNTINVDVLYPLTSGNYTINSAILVVNEIYKDRNRCITFLNAGGFSELWQLNGAISGWASASNWKKVLIGQATTSQIADNSITHIKMGASSVWGDVIQDGSISEVKLGAESVTTDKVKDRNITGAKVALNTIIQENIGGDLQLCAENFTTELKNKLTACTSYSSEQIDTAIGVVQAELDTLVGGNPTAALDSFNEIKAFLATITNDKTLAGILNDLRTTLETDYNTKITTLDSSAVHKTGNETVAGIKTFSSSPIIPTPTTDMQPSTKKYVDDTVLPINTWINEQKLLGKNVIGYYQTINASTPIVTFITGENSYTLLSCVKMGLFDSVKGTRNATFNGASLSKDINGNTRAIDGTEGDVMLYTDRKLYALLEVIIGTIQVTIFSDSELTYSGIKAKEFSPFSLSPQFTVNVAGKLMSVYNTAYAGTADTSIGFTANYRTANGFPTNSISQFTGMQLARAKNADTTKNFPYMLPMTWMNDILSSMLYAEAKTKDVSDVTRFGGGITTTFTPTVAQFDDSIGTACTGVRVRTSGAVEKGCYAWNATVFQVNAVDKVLYTMLGVGNNAYTEMLEGQRALGYAYDNNIAEGVKFQMAGTASNISYKYRSVPNCQGLSQGVMTGVVFKYVDMVVADGTTWKTTNATYGITAGDSAAGLTVTYQLSIPVYRGWHLYGDRFIQYVGRAVICHNELPANNPLISTLGINYKSMYYTHNWADVPIYTDSALATSRTDGSKFVEELKYVKIGDYATGDGWAKNCASGVPSVLTVSGAARNTYKCLYSYNIGTAASGSKENKASAFGCFWINGYPSPRSVHSYPSVSIAGYSAYVGALAVPDLDLAKENANS